MNKLEFIDKIRKNTEKTMTKADIEDVINTTFKVITEEVAAGGNVQIQGFGTFEVAERSERNGRNPQTGKPMVIAASRVPKFKAGKAFKDAVNGR